MKHTYTLNGSQIISEAWGNKLVVFLYDESGAPIGMQYRESTYPANEFDSFFYEKNLQGDIVGIFNKAGTRVVTYDYDAFGTPFVSCSSTYAWIDQINPFRYRGYYYDKETYLYYLNSRYYDYGTGRFISADVSDVLTATPMALTDKNLYAYCDNNPIMRRDDGGEFWNYIIGGAVGAIVGGVSAAISGGDWKEIALGAGVGAIGGVIAASGIPTGVQIVAGGLLSGGNNLATQTLIEDKSLQEVDWIDVGIDTLIGTGTSILSYGTTRNASKAADKIICKGVNRVVKGQQSLLRGDKYARGAIKRGMEIMDSGIKQMNIIRGVSSVIGSASSGLLTTTKSVFGYIFG